VTGNIKDSQGGVIPGATVVLISESRGTKLAPVVTNEAGDFVVPNVTADRYTVEVTMESFKTVRQTGIAVSGGDRIGVPAITLEAGAVAETVNVTAEAALVQSQSGERSFAITTEQIANLPVGRNFTSVTAFTPGVVGGGASAGGTRLGGVSQNNIMMDGIGIMDTGNNGQMLNMNIESIGEVKILTQGYQAEFGRSSGLQITAVTKSGTNQFRGSAYSVFTDSDWNANSWVRDKNGEPKLKTSTKTLGYTIGGPVGKPGAANKLFFFYAHDYRPTTQPINNGNTIRFRVPTLLERQGNFSQSLDNNGALIPDVLDPVTRQPFPNRTIPADRLYSLGVNILNRYPAPNVTQAAGTNYNYEIQPPTINNLTQQPAIRLDYQMNSKLRFTGRYAGDRARRLTTPGLISGFTDVLTPYPYITSYQGSVNYTINPTTFLEGTYGFTRNELTGGNENGVLVNETANRLSAAGGLANFPLLYPNAGVVDERYYAYEVMQDLNPVFWDGAKLNLPPVFGWGNRIGAAPPNQRYPGWLNINRTQDVAFSLTKVMGRHTVKAGFGNNHSFKAQNTGAGGLANLTFQGFVNFGNDTNNPIDTGFGYSNAALGVFTQYLQAEKFIEGSMIYNNTEFYVQDNWKVNNRLTLDAGLRFTRQQPQHDQFLQMSNFFPEEWSSAAAPVLYAAGCSNGAVSCSGNIRNAMDPRTGQILTIPGLPNTQAAIGTPIPGSGDQNSGIRRAGDGISDMGYKWPTLVVGPRFGMAYDLTGAQNLVFRAGGGLFYDRPDGNTVFSIPGNPPIATAQDLRNGQLQTVGTGTGLSTIGVPGLVTFQYDAKVPASWQWNGGVQMALPWAASFDISYVGNHGFNRLGGLQGGTTINQNSVDIGAAFLPQNQDRTQTSTVPGANTIDNALRTYRGLGNINQNTTEFWDTYHSIQTSLNRRFRDGFSFGVNYTYGISFKGNTGLQVRLQHAPDGSISVRSDQADYEKLLENLDKRPHIIKANAVWDLPNVSHRGLGVVLNDWQLSGVLTAGSAPAYDLTYSYNSNGSNKNITGSPDYAGRIVYLSDPGSGCSDDQYAQFNRASVTGPQYGSLGLESGRNLLRGCADKTIDLSLVRDIRVGGGRRLQLRLDAFNAFNTVVINGRQTQIQYNSPTDLTVRNPQFLADGSLNPARVKPNDAGFGAATGAQAMRNLSVQVRFQF
jgi:outer membrane receptor protein involved in Fe transport